MTPKKRLIAALLGSRNLDWIPVGTVTQTATLDQMAKLNIHFPEAHSDPDKMARLAAGAVELLGFDNLRVPFCQTVEAEVLGCKINFGDDTNLPAVASHPYKLQDRVSIDNDFMSKGRFPVVIEATRKLVSKYGQDFAVVSGIVGPFSIAGYMSGLTDLLIATLRESEKIRPFLELGVKIGAIYGRALADAGADIICVEDMSASTDIIRPDTYKNLILPYHKKLFDELRGSITVLHICGNTTPIISWMNESGADALSVDHKLNLSKALEIKGKTVILGNIDPVEILLQGRPDNILEKARRSIEDGVNILCPGCSLALGTSIENVRVLSNIKIKVPNKKMNEDLDQEKIYEIGREVGKLLKKSFQEVTQ